ncbi:MAG TPA: hypothetical protein VEI50_02195 [Nitrospiraceae bacterium]|nr:hypothetical protein [Nitrospiraceae bacterium]
MTGLLIQFPWPIQEERELEHTAKRLCAAHGLLCIALELLVTMGCSSVSHPKEEGKIHSVDVAHDVAPRYILAGRGDEVRWHNKGTQPIVVSFPASTMNRISCRTGFATEEQTALWAVIDPNSFASLCFGQLGKYNYHVRLYQNLASTLTDQRASVWIVSRGEKNAADPYEEYINFTP